MPFKRSPKQICRVPLKTDERGARFCVEICLKYGFIEEKHTIMLGEFPSVSPGIAGIFCICDSASWQGKAISQTVEMVLIFLAITPISDYNNKWEIETYKRIRGGDSLWTI